MEQLIAFRERLRKAVIRIESGASPTDAFLAEVNSLLLQYPRHTSLHKRDGKVIRETSSSLVSPPTSGRRSRCHGRSSRGNGNIPHSQMRIVCRSFLRHEQERLPSVVQYEHLWKQAQGSCLPEEKTWRQCHRKLASGRIPIRLHKSMTMSRMGCEQQTRRLPSAGFSSGSGP